MKFERIIKFNPPFDKRHKDDSKNYGIGSLRIFFILKKGENAVQVLISTNSYLQSVIKEYRHTHPNFMISDYDEDYEGYSCHDVGYHAEKPQYEGQSKMNDCDILKQGFCYYDGSSLRGSDDKIAEHFIKDGEEWIWKYLEEEFNSRFGAD